MISEWFASASPTDVLSFPSENFTESKVSRAILPGEDDDEDHDDEDDDDEDDFFSPLTTTPRPSRAITVAPELFDPSMDHPSISASKAEESLPPALRPLLMDLYVMLRGLATNLERIAHTANQQTALDELCTLDIAPVLLL
jgi:hypothetical protein